MRRPGLRTRIMAVITVGALAISATMAVASYNITRQTVLAFRERSALRAAYFDATVVSAGLSGASADVGQVLQALDTGASRHAVVARAGKFYARTADSGYTDALPADMRRLVAAGRPQVQRVRTAAGPALAIGIPLPGQAQFYIIDSLSELDRTLRVLSLVLTLVAAATTAAGALLGAYASRRTLRPMRIVTDAARDIAAGHLDARLDPATEPDLERLTTSFNHMVDQLASRLERDRRFAADVSHELRSPLQTLAASMSVLRRRRDRFDDRTGQALDLINDEVDRFMSLVTDLLELARSDQPAETEPVDVADLARQVCAAKGLPADLVTTADGPSPVWPLDRRRIEQVLANLLDNAERHGGGVCAVHVDTRAGALVLQVDDEGPGVPPEQRGVIFDRFVRGRPASARADTDGTGLGLALVAQHVQAHGGRVRVTDRPGGGARFVVELLAAPAVS